MSSAAESVTALDDPTSALIESKMDKTLINMLNLSDEEDLFNVTVWFVNPDKTKLLISLKSTMAKHNYTINEDLIVDNLSQLKDDSFKSLKDYNAFSKLYRESRKSVFYKHNRETMNTLNKRYSIEPKIFYYSRFTPFVILSITKEDLLKIQYDEDIISILYHEDDVAIEESSDEENKDISDSLTLSDRNSYPYGYWQNSTDIVTLRDAFHFEGDDVNIGLLEFGVPDTSLPVFADAMNENRITCLTTTPNWHASLTAAIIIGKTYNYKGVAYKANLLCSEPVQGIVGGEMITIEDFIDRGVNVISISLKLSNDQIYYDKSKFLDSIISDYGVTIGVCAGNYATNIYDPSLSYNSIVVGNINDQQTLTITDDEIASNSSYSSGNTAYKPDLAAPGRYAKNPFAPNLDNGGTSAATPIVTGICALLIQAFPYLAYRPMIIKSALLVSATHLPNMANIYSNSSSIEPALERQYGAGMVDAAAAYLLINHHNYKSISSINDMGSTVNTLEVAVSSGDVTHNKELFATCSWIQDVTCIGSPPYVNPYVLTGYHHELRLYDPQGSLVARSNYIYDRKQFIRYKPTQAGTYTLSVHKSGAPAYYAQAAIAYSKYHPLGAS